MPWHIERVHLAEGDTPRHCHRCVFYLAKDKYCTRTIGKCYSSAHCEYYSESLADKQLDDERHSAPSISKFSTESIVKAIYDIHVYEKQVEAKAEELLATMNSQIKQTQSDFLNNAQRFANLIYSYEYSLESRNQDVINKTIEMLNNCKLYRKHREKF